MLYDYICNECKVIFEVDKKITDPHPDKCLSCESEKIERYFHYSSIPSVVYANRPTWTYSDCKRYKECTFNGGPKIKIDPSKHGDLGSWHCE